MKIGTDSGGKVSGQGRTLSKRDDKKIRDLVGGKALLTIEKAGEEDKGSTAATKWAFNVLPPKRGPATGSRAGKDEARSGWLNAENHAWE